MPASLALDPRYVLWSAPEPQRPGRPLMVLMHGRSYDERHLFAFAHLFPGEMVVASVRAPYPEAGGPTPTCSRTTPSSSTRTQARPKENTTNDPVERIPARPRRAGVGIVLQFAVMAGGRLRWRLRVTRRVRRQSPRPPGFQVAGSPWFGLAGVLAWGLALMRPER
jgi:hypothetical protein